MIGPGSHKNQEDASLILLSNFAIASAGCGCGGFDLVIVVDVLKAFNPHWSSKKNQWVGIAFALTYVDCGVSDRYPWQITVTGFTNDVFMPYIYWSLLIQEIQIFWPLPTPHHRQNRRNRDKYEVCIITVLTCLLTISLMSMQAKMFVPVFFTS